MKKSIHLKEHQEIDLQLLIYLDQICQKHHLKYFVSDGTLLGAIRHQGFIPWDDDVDVWMPREDYHRLEAIINHEPPDCFRLLNYKNTKGYFWPFAKLVHTGTSLTQHIPRSVDTGVYIDIFPYDGIPCSFSRAFDIHWKLLDFLFRNSALAFFSYRETIDQNGSFGKWCKYLLRKLYGGKRILHTIELLCKKYKVESSSQVMCLCAGYKKTAVVPKELIEQVMVKPFAGYPVKVPAGYDQYLRIMYGDYMTLPPMEQRVPNASHLADVYWKNDKISNTANQE
ncbi:MAG: phosphorylcholine transferase LicD [Fusicatenibacter sp.]